MRINWILVGCVVVVLATVAGPNLLSHEDGEPEYLEQLEASYARSSKFLNDEETTLKFSEEALAVEQEDLKVQLVALMREDMDLEVVLENLRAMVSHLQQETGLHNSRCGVMTYVGRNPNSNVP